MTSNTGSNVVSIGLLTDVINDWIMLRVEPESFGANVPISDMIYMAIQLLSYVSAMGCQASVDAEQIASICR